MEGLVDDARSHRFVPSLLLVRKGQVESSPNRGGTMGEDNGKSPLDPRVRRCKGEPKGNIVFLDHLSLKSKLYAKTV